MNIEPFDIVLIAIIAGAFVVCLYGLKMVIKEGFLKSWNLFAGFVFGLLLVSYLIYNVISHEIDPKDWVLIFLTLGLVMVTVLYALVAFRQANANVKMVEEMREQRIISSRPVLIQKAVVETETKLRTFGSLDWFSHFEIYNAGNGPAIEVVISLLDRGKTPIHSERKSFLRSGESPIVFSPTELTNLEKSTYYLVTEYKSVLAGASQPTWYQTRLPFETINASREGKIYVKPGELEFKEVLENERIDVFSEGKPK